MTLEGVKSSGSGKVEMSAETSLLAGKDSGGRKLSPANKFGLALMIIGGLAFAAIALAVLAAKRMNYYTPLLTKELFTTSAVQLGLDGANVTFHLSIRPLMIKVAELALGGSITLATSLEVVGSVLLLRSNENTETVAIASSGVHSDTLTAAKDTLSMALPSTDTIAATDKKDIVESEISKVELKKAEHEAKDTKEPKGKTATFTPSPLPSTGPSSMTTGPSSFRPLPPVPLVLTKPPKVIKKEEPKKEEPKKEEPKEKETELQATIRKVASRVQGTRSADIVVPDDDW